MGIGCFPLYCYEGDSMHTILGCNTVFTNGVNFPPSYSYEYDMQPLIYVVVPFLKLILPFLNLEQIFCLLTAIAALINVILSIELVYRLTKLNRLLILFATFLLPESIAIGMYPNTAIFAMLFVVTALHLLLSKRFILSTIFLIIAPVFRIDVLIIYPTVLVILWWMGYSIWKSIKTTSIIAFAVLGGIIIAYSILQANPLTTTLGGYEKWNNTISSIRVFIAVYTYYTICNLLLIPIGIYKLLKNKDIKLLSVIIVPIVLNHIVYARMGCATKHYLYMMPFTISLSTLAIQFLKDKARPHSFYKYSLIITILLYTCISIRFKYPNRPWLNQIYSMPQQVPCINLLNESYTKYQFSIGLGGGLLLKTYDEFMLFSGNLFYPIYINKYKTEQLAKRNHAYKYMKEKLNISYLGSSWDDMANIAIAYTNNNYLFSSNDNEFILKNKDNKISILRHEIDEDNDENARYNIWYQTINMLKKDNNNLYCFTLVDSHIYNLDKLSRREVVNKLTNNLYYIKK